MRIKMYTPSIVYVRDNLSFACACERPVNSFSRSRKVLPTVLNLSTIQLTNILCNAIMYHGDVLYKLERVERLL